MPLSPPRMSLPSPGAPVPWRRIGEYLVFAAAAVIVFWSFFSTYHSVRPGQVAVIKNNITGQETVQLSEGIIIHLPWGITDVYVLDKTLHSVVLSGADSVVIKTREGANVDAHVEVTFSLVPSQAAQIVRGIGMGPGGADLTKINDVVYSYVRSKVRDEIGKLSLDELARPEERTARIEETKLRLNAELAQYGVEIQTVSATDWDYDKKYEEMIKHRKEADQIFVNQAAAQETNRKKQETAFAEQNRLKSNAVAEAAGEVQKEIIAKEAWALEQRAQAEGASYKTKKDADAASIRLQNEAAATEAELMNRAQGIQALAAAYASGGINLVKEVLAAKLKGVQIHGRPFSNDASPQRVQVEQVAPETLRTPGGSR